MLPLPPFASPRQGNNFSFKLAPKPLMPSTANSSALVQRFHPYSSSQSRSPVLRTSAAPSKFRDLRQIPSTIRSLLVHFMMTRECLLCSYDGPIQQTSSAPPVIRPLISASSYEAQLMLAERMKIYGLPQRQTGELKWLLVYDGKITD